MEDDLEGNMCMFVSLCVCMGIWSMYACHAHEQTEIYQPSCPVLFMQMKQWLFIFCLVLKGGLTIR